MLVTSQDATGCESILGPRNNFPWNHREHLAFDYQALKMQEAEALDTVIFGGLLILLFLAVLNSSHKPFFYSQLTNLPGPDFFFARLNSPAPGAAKSVQKKSPPKNPTHNTKNSIPPPFFSNFPKELGGVSTRESNLPRTRVP